MASSKDPKLNVEPLTRQGLQALAAMRANEGSNSPTKRASHGSQGHLSKRQKKKLRKERRDAEFMSSSKFDGGMKQLPTVRLDTQSCLECCLWGLLSVVLHVRTAG